MNNRTISNLGITGACLFLITAVIGGLLIDDYDIVSQYISESYAIDTKYGLWLRILGFIPSGIFIFFFFVFSTRCFKDHKWAIYALYGLAIFYGLATVVVAIFPCDSGCNKEWIDPSISQIIHNIVGLSTYLFVPICIVTFAKSIIDKEGMKKLFQTSMVCAVLSISSITPLFVNPDSPRNGLNQRIVELFFIVWLISLAVFIRKMKNVS